MKKLHLKTASHSNHSSSINHQSKIDDLKIKKSNVRVELLKNVCKITSGKHQPKSLETKFWDNENGFPWVRIGDLTSHITTTKNKLSQLGIETKKNGLFFKNTICVARVGATLGKVGWLNIDAYFSDVVFNFDTKNKNILINRYLYFYFLTKRKAFFLLKRGTSIPRINKSQLENLKIPLPPIKEQQEIVEKLNVLEEYRNQLINTINLNKALFKNYLATTFEQIKKSNIKFELLKNVCRIISGKHNPKPSEAKFWDNESGFPWMRIGDLTSHIITTKKKLSQLGIETKKNGLFLKNTICFANYGPVGKVGWLNVDAYSSGYVINFDSKNKNILSNRYLYLYFLQNKEKIKALKIGTALPRINKSQLENWKIPLSPITEQQKIIKKLDAFSDYQFKREQEIIKIDFLLKNSMRVLIN